MKKGTSVVIDAEKMELVPIYQAWHMEETGIRLSRTQAINGLVTMGGKELPSRFFTTEVTNGEA